MCVCGYDCRDTEPSECTYSCGDGVQAYDEECDDGNSIDDDGCSSGCTIEAGYVCNDPTGCGASNCFWLTGNEICGDGMTLGAELEMAGFCDDGNEEDGDGCSSECVIEYGYECMNEEGMASDCMYTCGDGLIAVGSEECDDGNEEDGDGCSSECEIEYGYECMNEEGMASECWFGDSDGSNSCEYAYDGECDEPEYCDPGTDTSDCSGGSTPGTTLCA